MVDQIFQQWSIQNGFNLELLASNSRADDGENSGADHRANSKGREAQPTQRLFQPNFGVFGI
jgi:hypothetical protein